MKIQTLTQISGLSAPAIRYYEKEGLLDERHVRREANNYREYTEEAAEHLLLIKRLQSAGFTLSELKKLIRENDAHGLSLPKVIELLQEKISEIGRKQAEQEQVQGLLSRMLRNKLARLKSGAGAPEDDLFQGR
ncbi:MerR family transcriptional regulator [Paenibacillus sp. HN-1]|uniref:MerR family transcriptional regulator n=1 Tax=Paenibacillus TaxID=44249 RepID=UPI001CA9A42F|nr:MULTISPECIES: MerR family transcriptional regulator [Paenibacillus]MBY9080027.1 MerR family transcriptional regulator [Paenibacillus sp. CGMCC 1.18879]MBY9086725.1 MerR family transcriptional regulator [Paenibacillus sinensis]